MSEFSNYFLVLLPLFAAVLGSLITVIGNTLKENKKQKKFEKQVENIMKESCKRVIIYLEAMEKDEYEEAIVNLKYRIEGIRVVERLLSDFTLDKIIGTQIYVVFRIREQINDLIGDLSNFNDNYFKIRQFEVDINQLIKRSGSKKEREELEKQKDYYSNKLKTDYKKDLLRQIDENKKLFQTLIKNYYLISDNIKQFNESL